VSAGAISALAYGAALAHNGYTARTPTTDPDDGQDRLAHRVLHDPLTDLPNRTLFLDRLALALARLRRHQTSIAVLFIDLDNFKIVNDSLGHNAGDKLLVELGGRLRDAIRPSDTIARFGGDEFVVLCEDITDARVAVMVGQRIVSAAAEPFLLEGREMFVSASVGVALALDSDATPETLLRDSDAAMYRAKERGNGRVEVFDEALRTRIMERLDLENGLRRALQRDEFRVYYQPEVSSSQGRMIAVEALVRWEHPDRGLLEPKDFVPLAEETGLIVDIGEWVLNEACRQIAAWRARGAEIDVAVNVSARQLVQSDIVEVVRGALERSGLPADALCLEITESAVMRDPEAAHATLTLVKELGVKVALDDFGVGFSSLAQLKEMLPLHALKVDRSFISGIADDERNSAIVAAVVMLANTLGLTAIAEGVETEAQALQARALGCDVSQGYYFTAPEPAAMIAARLGRDDLLTPAGAV
jgi:diguanylate cyclase (GGDEF)-like protein